MSFLSSVRFWAILGVVLLAAVVGQQVWKWEVERIEVDPEEFVVRVHRWGKDLESGQILAPDDSYKGVMLDVLPEGRHFLNPIFWRADVHKVTKVPNGKCLVLTRKYGKPISKERLERGEILARGQDGDADVEQGIVAEVKGPGTYRINPYAYEAELASAVEVKDNQVGVRTLKVGLDPRELPPLPASKGRYVVPKGYRGVQQESAPPGTYYLNPHVETITPVDVRSHKVELADIEFPSRDGFPLKPQVIVEYKVRASMAAELLVRLTDEGIIHQEHDTLEQQEKNEILQKALLPQIRGYARIEGSNFDARDFIVTDRGAGAQKGSNSREVLQRALFAKVKPRCEELGIEVLSVSLAALVPPPELSQQIGERDLARVEQEKNKVRLGQYKSEQSLKAREALKQQSKEKVEVATRLVRAKTKAEQMKQVEEARLKQDLANAQLKLEASRKQAEATLAKGKADAAVTLAQNEAEVAGLRTAVRGFNSAHNFAQYHMLNKLAPALSEIFSSDDGEFAKLFSGYMTPGNGTAPGAAARPAQGPPRERLSTPPVPEGSATRTGSGNGGQ